MPDETEFLFRPVGRIRCGNNYPSEAPRQAVYAARGAFLEWSEPRQLAPAAADLAGFDRVWLIFVFDRNLGHLWKPKVRPPLSGDGKRRGLFATRSPHRPNPVGLSAVELRAVTPAGLELGPCDLLDGTPVLDVKPYIPAADAFPDSRAGWRDAVPEDAYEVLFTPEALAAIALIRDHGGPDLENFCRVQLAFAPCDRRRKRLTPPADGGGLWTAAFRTWRLFFRCDDAAHRVTVTGAASGYTGAELAPEAPDPYGDKALHRLFRERSGVAR